jgi:hypothetical protein
MITAIDLAGLSADQPVNDLCFEILERAGEPLHYRDIASLVLQVRPLTTKTPEKSVYSRMLTDTQERYALLGSGVFGLRDIPGDARLP